MVDFKKLSDVEVVAEPIESANILIEEDGIIKKAPKTFIGNSENNGRFKKPIVLNMDIVEYGEHDAEGDYIIRYDKIISISEEDKNEIVSNLTANREFCIIANFTDINGSISLFSYVPYVTYIKYSEISDTRLGCAIYSKLPDRSDQPVDVTIYMSYSPYMGLSISVSDYDY